MESGYFYWKNLDKKINKANHEEVEKISILKDFLMTYLGLRIPKSGKKLKLYGVPF